MKFKNKEIDVGDKVLIEVNRKHKDFLIKDKEEVIGFVIELRKDSFGKVLTILPKHMEMKFEEWKDINNVGNFFRVLLKNIARSFYGILSQEVYQEQYVKSIKILE
ncbi:MAG: hypothetical protein ACOCRX_08405 [Candidatus Woesearchaeota archaeon]